MLLDFVTYPSPSRTFSALGRSALEVRKNPVLFKSIKKALQSHRALKGGVCHQLILNYPGLHRFMTSNLFPSVILFYGCKW